MNANAIRAMATEPSHNGGVSKGEESSKGNRPFALPHELARDIVACRDMVGVYRVPETECIGEKGGARLIAKALGAQVQATKFTATSIA